MKSTSPIVAGIDFSASSAQVLHHALHSSTARETPVIALHVLDDSRLPFRRASGNRRPDLTAMEDEAKTKLAEWVSAQSSASNLQTELRCGRPADELRKAVIDHDASLLVIAANDTSKNRLGSIASSCVRSAPCDVMVLRNWQHGDFKKIAICTDFSPTAARVLSRAVSIAGEQGAELNIIHVIYPPTRDLWGEVLEHSEDSPQSFAEECHTRTDASMSAFIEPHRDALAGIKHRCIVLESIVPSVAITNHIADTGADLVIMGTRGHSRFMSHFIGTNAERLMHDSPVSVLAIRSPEE